MAMSENTINVIKYLQENKGADVTAADVAAALGLDKRQVDGAFTAGICRKGMGERVAAEVELEDGTHRTVKFLKLNSTGMAWTGEEANA